MRASGTAPRFPLVQYAQPYHGVQEAGAERRMSRRKDDCTMSELGVADNEEVAACAERARVGLGACLAGW